MCTYIRRSIMSDVSNDNRVLSLGNRAGLRQSLTTLLDQLGRCQKALNEFLEVWKLCLQTILLQLICSCNFIILLPL